MICVCSIIGYKGKQSAAPILVDSLKRMEYRGYDSVGVATFKDGDILVKKGTGKVAEVSKSLNISAMSGMIGIGHTRWATHGGVTDSNAHPHSACKNNIAVVHNGIIENYKELKEELIKTGHVFSSETDSEVIAHLLEVHADRGIKGSLTATCKRLKGTYAFVAVFQDGTIAGARYEEPLIIGVANDGYFISSDVLGFLQYTDKAIFLDNYDIVLVDGSKMEIFNFDGNPVAHPITQVAWELGEVDKGKYAHYTLKEINDQRVTVANAARQDEAMMEKFCKVLSDAKSVYITGSGTSYHSALIMKHMLARYAKIRAETVMSSEAQDGLVGLDEGSALVAFSQSGETADVLESVKIAKKQGAKILGIVNVTTSSLARASDAFLSVNCGPEIGVAATKSFTGQLALVYNIVSSLAPDTLAAGEKAEFVKAVEKVIASSQLAIEKMASKMEQVNDIYLLGRSTHYPIALEGALKLKELAYVHAEGVAAGELKHGPLALMEKNTLVILLNPRDATYNDSLSNAHEIKARGASVIGISDAGSEVYDHWVEIPHMTEEAFYPIVEVIPLQMLAYYLALAKNADPDYPRNLAKSVTVK
ncbi:glutamine--fructose-6-phosphate transaminase [Candidatus Nitrososphaera evergladensis SR1]|jgi:glucosamine--fructose-6-phosphate aminotransferase (isomerizing)|uniref:Glutamine--fructose-6-phosphate aminotransferase [isomerizing] n=1 Tax=Candidatus Nitrososphaera evergladensis SR1 TaxID=1459636 RepID=A0A075MU88_9ARCH|nr:glutamine--fructose-6-phosphate transaminase (isomerizing) [Candidatus Nitrososphaera evergladensis]AIF84277.1 glutamine--fructose-6-phosphate transaminase [Candidatus Nitrososphaera evergladensis SR1]